MSSILSQFAIIKTGPSGSIEQDLEEVTARVPDALMLSHGMIPMLMANLTDCKALDPALQAQNRSSFKI
jgi:hypothetical protein